MNDEVKEILIDLIDYYNTMGTSKDPGVTILESVVQRASSVVETHATKSREGKENKNSADVDPFEQVSSLESISKHSYEKGFELYKLEDEW